MVHRLGQAFLEQDCAVIGASNGPACAAFNRSGECTLDTRVNPPSCLWLTRGVRVAARPNPNKIVSIMSDQGNPDRLFFLDRIEPFSLIDDWIAGSPDAKLPPSFTLAVTASIQILE